LKTLTIGTRGSKLALWQAEHIKARLESLEDGLKVEIKIIKTTGDKILDTPLAKIGGKGLFTKEIEEEMLGGSVDIAVHSLKDVPVELPKSLILSAITEREDVRDAFVSVKYKSIDELPANALIGTTSLRRQMQLKRYRKDIRTKSLRGNLQTRLKKLEEGEFDAIILAYAGIRRLGLEPELKVCVPVDTKIMTPAMGQAALGIETQEGSYAYTLTQKLNHEDTVIATTIEREFVKALEGGCQVPIGVYAKVSGEDVVVEAIIGLPDGSESLELSTIGKKSNYIDIGKNLAEDAISKGARELLKRAEEMAFKDE